MKRVIVCTLIMIMFLPAIPARAAPVMEYYVIGIELPTIRQEDNSLCGILSPFKPYVPLFCVQQVSNGWQITANTNTFEIAWIEDTSVNRVYGSASVLIDGNIIYTIRESTCEIDCPDRFHPIYTILDFIVPIGQHTIQVLKNSDDTQPINLEYIGYYYNSYQAFIPFIQGQ